MWMMVVVVVVMAQKGKILRLNKINKSISGR
jgi:hypothetical protein